MLQGIKSRYTMIQKRVFTGGNYAADPPDEKHCEGHHVIHGLPRDLLATVRIRQGTTDWF